MSESYEITFSCTLRVEAGISHEEVQEKIVERLAGLSVDNRAGIGVMCTNVAPDK